MTTTQKIIKYLAIAFALFLVISIFSIIFGLSREIISSINSDKKDSKLLEENDNVMVCISGGKDSFLLAKCIQEIQRHGKIKFNAHYVVMDPGYKDINKNLIISNAKKYLSPSKISDKYLEYYGANSLCIYRYPFASTLSSEVLKRPLDNKEKNILREKNYMINFLFTNFL